MAKEAFIFNGLRYITWMSLPMVAKSVSLCQMTGLLMDSKVDHVAFQNILVMWQGVEQMQIPFFELFCAIRNFRSTDPRDEIYALLGIPQDHLPVAPSYVKDVTDVFEESTARVLLGGSLEHLAATVYLEDAARTDLPSWVPDWSSPVDSWPFEALAFASWSKPNAGGHTAPSLYIGPGPHLLSIKGRIVSSISRIGTKIGKEVNDIPFSDPVAPSDFTIRRK
jgi:hypothetical protein